MYSKNKIEQQLQEMAQSNLDRLGITESDVNKINSFHDGFNISSIFYESFLNLQSEYQPSLKAVECSELLLEAGIGMLLIRPEFYAWSSEVEEFLRKNDFEIVYTNTVKVDSPTYQIINEHVINNPATCSIMPTRTAVYTSGNSLVVLFRDKQQRNQKFGLKLPDFFCKHFKGRHAIQQPNTLRGDVVLSNIKTAGYANPSGLTALAIDPVKDFRHIVSENLRGEHLVLNQPEQLLEYTGVCIHVPNTAEFVKDCSCLVPANDLEILIATLFFNEQ